MFLDETWVNQNECVGKCWTVGDGVVAPKLNSGYGSRFIVLHAGSEEGFLQGAILLFKSTNGAKGDYHDSIDHDKFKKWFQDHLVLNIRERPLIMLDNASYHSKIEKKAPTCCNNKSGFLLTIYHMIH